VKLTGNTIKGKEKERPLSHRKGRREEKKRPPLLPFYHFERKRRNEEGGKKSIRFSLLELRQEGA